METETLPPALAGQVERGVRPLAGLIEHLRDEADFQRSWIDGRRGDRAVDATYIMARTNNAARSEAWAKEIEGLLAGGYF